MAIQSSFNQHTTDILHSNIINWCDILFYKINQLFSRQYKKKLYYVKTLPSYAQILTLMNFYWNSEFIKKIVSFYIVCWVDDQAAVHSICKNFSINLTTMSSFNFLFLFLYSKQINEIWTSVNYCCFLYTLI